MEYVWVVEVLEYGLKRRIHIDGRQDVINMQNLWSAESVDEGGWKTHHSFSCQNLSLLLLVLEKDRCTYKVCGSTPHVHFLS